jgi:hypothetical protein
MTVRLICKNLLELRSVLFRSSYQILKNNHFKNSNNVYYIQLTFIPKKVDVLDEIIKDW